MLKCLCVCIFLFNTPPLCCTRRSMLGRGHRLHVRIHSSTVTKDIYHVGYRIGYDSNSSCSLSVEYQLSCLQPSRRRSYL